MLFVCVLEIFKFLFNIHSLIHTFFCVFGGSGSVGWCAFFVFWGTTSSFNNCFWKIWVALIRAYWCDLMQADLLVWADSAGWTAL